MDEHERLGVECEARGDAAVQPVADDRNTDAERIGGVDAAMVEGEQRGTVWPRTW
jgi:hypothetical protein